MDIHLPNYSIDMYWLVLYHKFWHIPLSGEWAMADVLTHVAAFLPDDRRQLWADLSLTQFTFPYCPIIFHQGIWPRHKRLIPQFESCILVIGLTKPIHNPCIPKLEKELRMFNWKDWNHAAHLSKPAYDNHILWVAAVIAPVKSWFIAAVNYRQRERDLPLIVVHSPSHLHQLSYLNPIKSQVNPFQNSTIPIEITNPMKSEMNHYDPILSLGARPPSYVGGLTLLIPLFLGG